MEIKYKTGDMVTTYSEKTKKPILVFGNGNDIISELFFKYDIIEAHNDKYGVFYTASNWKGDIVKISELDIVEKTGELPDGIDVLDIVNHKKNIFNKGE